MRSSAKSAFGGAAVATAFLALLLAGSVLADESDDNTSVIDQNGDILVSSGDQSVTVQNGQVTIT